MSAGDNKTKTFGKEKVLKVEESVSSIGKKERVDTDTKQTSIAFDISEIAATDTVDSAVLKLCGRNVSEQGGDMYMVVYRNDAIAYTEEKTTWNNYDNGHIAFSYWGEKYQLNNNTLGYTGYPYANFRYTEDLGRMGFAYGAPVNRYYYTKDEFYAQIYIKTIGDFITQYSGGSWMNSSLDLANRTLNVCKHMVILLESEYATPEWFTALAKHLWANNNLMYHHAPPSSNWGTAEAAGQYAVSAYFPEFYESDEWINRSSTSDGLYSATYRVKHLIDSDIRSDYTFKESALGYADYFATTVMNLYSIADITGIDFNLGEKYENKFVNMMRYVMDLSTPGFRQTQWGDEYEYTTVPANYKPVGERFDDSYLVYAGTKGKEGKEPEYTSKFYPTGKIGAMRTDWSDQAYYLMTEFNGQNTHGHFDDLSIIVMAKGKYLIADPSLADYNSNPYKELQRPESHNLVKVNDCWQPGSSGTTNDWVTNNSFDFLSGSKKDTDDNSSTPDNNWTRNIMFVRGKFWIVNDYVEAGDPTKKNKFRQLWHLMPSSNFTIDDETKILRSNFDDVNIQVVQADPENCDYEIKECYYRPFLYMCERLLCIFPLNR